MLKILSQGSLVVVWALTLGPMLNAIGASVVNATNQTKGFFKRILPERLGGSPAKGTETEAPQLSTNALIDAILKGVGGGVENDNQKKPIVSATQLKIERAKTFHAISRFVAESTKQQAARQAAVELVTEAMAAALQPGSRWDRL